MFKSLRNRLILSHILPLLIILPLMGIGLIYVLETQVFLPALADELENDAQFLARLTRTDESIWASPEDAQSIVTLYSMRNNARVMLLDARGALLATNQPTSQKTFGQVIPGLDFTAIANSSQATQKISYSPRQNAEIIDVFIPVKTTLGRLLGFVRISYLFASLTDDIYQLRSLIFVMLALGLLIGSGVGYILAVSVATPIREITRAISALSHNSQAKLISIYGPEEIRSLSQSVNDLVTRLRESELSRQKLLSNLVHELGRPLGALRSGVTALLGGADQDPALYHDLLKGMDDETQQLQRLLNDLAGLHDEILGAHELERQAIDLNTWLPEALSTWQAAAHEKGIHWEMLQEDEPLNIFADPNRLSQILGNLVSNAIKFTPAHGTITISTSITPEQVGISVSDSGAGVAQEEQVRIFQRYYRGANGRRFPQGMGLGLSIARELTEAHGGHLSIESAPGEGSRFTVWLPSSAS